MTNDRIDYSDGRIDDVVVHNVEMFRLEFMDDNQVWMRCYRKDGTDIVFRLSSSTPITGHHEMEDGE